MAKQNCYVFFNIDKKSSKKQTLHTYKPGESPFFSKSLIYDGSNMHVIQ